MRRLSRNQLTAHLTRSQATALPTHRRAKVSDSVRKRRMYCNQSVEKTLSSELKSKAKTLADRSDDPFQITVLATMKSQHFKKQA